MFGILLWEMFSLGAEVQCTLASELGKPKYADDSIFQLMQACWKDELLRIHFEELHEKLFGMLNGSIEVPPLNLEACVHFKQVNAKKQ